MVGATTGPGMNGVVGLDLNSGTAEGFAGVTGLSKNGHGVRGRHGDDEPPDVGSNRAGVYGGSKSGVGVLGQSQDNNAVLGISHDPTAAAISAVNLNSGPGLFVRTGLPNGHCATFVGNVGISGDVSAANLSCSGNINILSTGDILFADCAENFAIADPAVALDPGTVVVLDERGGVRSSTDAYDKRVAGVVSGAGNFRPGIVLGRSNESTHQAQVALLGKVYCKVDATEAPIEIGDLLTTSGNSGHAMKATDQTKAFGSVLGKALRPQPNGVGMIPVLVALQ